jgi:deoxyribodipyrimidine photo-lyase
MPRATPSTGSGSPARGRCRPYFRIFNPELQAKKFDPDGRYVREWAPDAADREPLVDLKASRDAALAAYEAVKNAR